MKKFFLLLFLFVSLFVSSQSYYYFCGKKIELTEVPNQASVITTTSLPQHLAPFRVSNMPDSIRIENIPNRGPYTISVVRETYLGRGSLSRYLQKNINPNYHIILPCYTTQDGMMLITTNNIYVELYKSEDISKLNEFAELYHLSIVRQNLYMPLWYVVSISTKTPYKTVEMANILYETGEFQSVEPEFRFNAIEGIS